MGGSPQLLAKTSSPLRWVPMATTLPAAWGFAMQRSEAEFMDLMGFHFTIKRNDVMLTNDDTMINWLVVSTYPSEKYWPIGMIIPNIWDNKCPKPPTSK